ncbi:cytochrome c-type biogenesis protein [Solirhodobacter olei]|uniref:cytochrome c-type biogenesis protein n=1 Tax=Solirhodobacter olei TaxID=2493082 RepID=UPI000FDBAFE1|nr:cytochrome c-type biogenesis protein [Solirhodobacter olei]
MRRLALILALVLAPLAAQAVLPSEMLKDPALEARAEKISQGLRCLVCRNENIDDSDAALAHDLRVLVRQRLLAGDTDKQVVQYIVNRYGEYVLLKPRANGANLILWGSAPGMLIFGLGLVAVYLRRRKRQGEETPALSAEDEARLAQILKE